MPGVTDELIRAVNAALAGRWQAVDALLPAPRGGGGGRGELLAVPGGELPAAIGECWSRQAPPGSFELVWGAALRFQLTARVAGPDIAGALDALLAQWRAHLDGQPGADGEDTAALVNWPSRDVQGVPALIKHGLQPLTVVAASLAEGVSAAGRRTGAGSAEADQDYLIRRAGPQDIEAVAELGRELITYDAYSGAATWRPDTLSAMRQYAVAALAEPQPCVFLAERGDRAIGLVVAEPRADWIAPLTGLAPVAYLSQLSVAPAERGTGVGAALAARMHDELDAAGTAITLLHYAQVNPLSVPFWNRMGYRPLWTTWQVRPALAFH